MSESSSSDEGEGLDPAARPIRMHPLFDTAVLGATPCGQRLCYSTDACERLVIRDGWGPEDAWVRVARMATVLLPRWPDFLD